jgi:hypothetical protein
VIPGPEYEHPKVHHPLGFWHSRSNSRWSSLWLQYRRLPLNTTGSVLSRCLPGEAVTNRDASPGRLTIMIAGEACSHCDVAALKPADRLLCRRVTCDSRMQHDAVAR